MRSKCFGSARSMGFIAIACAWCCSERASGQMYVPPISKAFHDDIVTTHRLDVDSKWLLDVAFAAQKQQRADLELVEIAESNWIQFNLPSRYEYRDEEMTAKIVAYQSTRGDTKFDTVMAIEADYFAALANCIGDVDALRARQDWTRSWFLQSDRLATNLPPGARFDVIANYRQIVPDAPLPTSETADAYRTAVHAQIETLLELSLQSSRNARDRSWTRELGMAQSEGDIEASARILRDQLDDVRSELDDWNRLRRLNLLHGLKLAEQLEWREALKLRAKLLGACCPYLLEHGELPERIIARLLDDPDEDVEALRHDYESYWNRVKVPLSLIDESYRHAFGSDARALTWLIGNLELCDAPQEAQRVTAQLAAREAQFNDELQQLVDDVIKPMLRKLNREQKQ